MLADPLTKTSTGAKRTGEFFHQRGQRWRLIYDPLYQSERRCNKKELGRLVAPEEQEPEQHGDFVGALLESLSLDEDGWVKFPKDPTIETFLTEARQRVSEADDDDPRRFHMPVSLCRDDGMSEEHYTRTLKRYRDHWELGPVLPLAFVDTAEKSSPEARVDDTNLVVESDHVMNAASV